MPSICANLPRAPRAAKRPQRATILKYDERVDDYAWLRAENWREAIQDPNKLPADIRSYIEAENAYLKAAMDNTEDLQKRLFTEIKGRIEESYQSVPIVDGTYAYYYRYRAGQQYPVFCRCADGDSNTEKVLLDANQEAKHYAHFQVADCCHSPDHRYIAYSADTEGSERHSIYIIDTYGDCTLDEGVMNTQGEVVWSNDSQYIFYVQLDEEYRPAKVFRHRIGTSSANDILVYAEADNRFFVNLDKTRSRRFIVITTHTHDTSECRLLDADTPLSEPRLVKSREPKVRYDIEHQRDNLLIHTNADGADDYKIAYTAIDDLSGHWSDLYIPPSAVLLEDMMVFDSWLVCYEYANGLPRINIFRVSTDHVFTLDHVIALNEDDACYAVTLEENESYYGNILRFSYSSLIAPESIYDYDMRTRERILRKRQVVPSGHTSSAYTTERVFATAYDGTKIPISLFYANATPPSPASPLLLYGYGAYGHIIPARFATSRLSLVDRGFVFAIAHIRGGMEKGYHWYRNGKLENKENTFRDFIACAEHLCTERYTSPSCLAIHGGSAGGMLIGAVLNMRPDLFSAAIADVPFVDVLTTMCDDELPLTPTEWDEWGNPIQSAEAYERIAHYSPYDNVTSCAYPHILVTAGISDPRVTYWEPAKWVAKLRAHNQSDSLVLLKTLMTAGHAGHSGRYDTLEEVALQYAFLLKALDVKDGTCPRDIRS